MNMRILSIFFLSIIFKVAAQQPTNYCKQINDIAFAEKLAHQRLNSTTSFSVASNNFDVKYYRLEIQVDPAVRFITGKVTVYYKITNNTTNIVLDLMNPLVVDNVQQGANTLANSQINNSLQINFPLAVTTGTIDSVSIYYHGVPPNTGFGSFNQTTHASTPVLWSLSEPYGARDWWPCKNGLTDKADSIDVLITAPSQYTAASNGLLQWIMPSPTDATQNITYWKHRYPIATYLVCFAVTNYVMFNNSVQLGAVTLPMQTFCYPENLSSFQAGTQNVLDALQLYNNTFGPYPFINEKYGHVQFGWGGGMEHQTSTFIVSIAESLITHELAHQWFGDKITCGSWQDIWLNEGFATHIASFYNENKYPASTIANRQSDINFITSQVGGSVWVDDTTTVNRIFDSRLSYYKGSHLLYMLRWILSDSVFFAALKNYQTDTAIKYGFALTTDLKRNLEQTSGKNLTSFFNEWFYGQGYPSYHVQWRNAGAGSVAIKLNQTTSHPAVSFFELPVALQFKNATQQKTVVVNNTINDETFVKNIGFLADTVLIDPNYWLITNGNTTTKLNDSLYLVAPLTPPSPAGNFPQCNVTITRTSNPPVDEIWYWQGNACDTITTLGSGSSFTTFTSGTYFIRSYKPSCDCWSSSCSSVSVIIDSTTNVWIGTISTDWTNANNWSCGTVPSTTTHIIIPSGTLYSAIIPNGVFASCKSISILPGAIVTVSTNANLKVYN